MTNPRYPELIGEIGHRGDKTGGPPPAGLKAAPGTWQGGAVNLPGSYGPARQDLLGDIAHRGDTAGTVKIPQPKDPYSTKRGRDLKSSWEWLRFCADLPADPIPFGPITVGTLLESGRCIYWGTAFSNNGTASGTLKFLDGLDSTGGEIDRIGIGASATTHNSGPSRGILCEQGIFMVPTTVTAVGVVWLTHLWKYPFTPPGE